MRITAIVVLALFLFIGCESPQDLSNEQVFYKGQVVQNERASFVLDGNNLSKDLDGILILDEEVSDGTVYGLEDDETVYTAEGGEILPLKSWVGNISADPVKVSLTSNLVIKFEELTSVTILDAVDMIYIAANGSEVLFSGSGVITTTEISTGTDGFVTLISTTEFSIGGHGGEDA